MSLQRALIRTGWPPLMDLGCACGDGCCFACNPTEAVTLLVTDWVEGMRLFSPSARDTC